MCCSVGSSLDGAIAPWQGEGDIWQSAASPGSGVGPLIAEDSDMTRDPVKCDSRIATVEKKEALVDSREQLDVVSRTPGFDCVNDGEGVSENRDVRAWRRGSVVECKKNSSKLGLEGRITIREANRDGSGLMDKSSPRCAVTTG